jgi:hypothetical protein
LKPIAESCFQNQDVILKQLQLLCTDSANVLEIGSGTGQHAAYFSRQLNHLNWYTSDRLENHPGIKLWLDESQLPNVYHPFELDVVQSNWPELSIDIVFTANTVHIMSLTEVEALFKGVGQNLNKGGLFIIYGPFNYHGQYTSQSNAQFDIWLKQGNENSGIKDVDFLNSLAKQSALEFIHDIEMPANNKMLCWKKLAG